MLVQGWSIEETLRVATPTDELEVKVFPHVAESHVGVLINNSAVGTESKLSVPPSKAKRLPHEALISVEVQLLVCTHTELRGTTAVKLGAPWLVKDSTAGRYFCKPLQVYKGTQSARAVNWSGGHSMRRPSLLRIGSE